MNLFRAAAVTLLACIAGGCVTMTTTTRIAEMQKRIAALEDELRLARGTAAIEAKDAKPKTRAEQLHEAIALLDLELVWVRENLGPNHAKTVDTKARRARLAKELEEIESGRGNR